MKMTTNDDDVDGTAAKERKRKRLEAWRKRKQEQLEDEEKRQRTTTSVLVSTEESTAAYTAAALSSSNASNESNQTSNEAAPNANIPKLKIGLSSSSSSSNLKGKKKKKKRIQPRVDVADFLGEGEEKKEEEKSGSEEQKEKVSLLGLEELAPELIETAGGGIVGEKRPVESIVGADSGSGSAVSDAASNPAAPKRRRRGRWDVKDEDGPIMGSKAGDEGHQVTTSTSSTTIADEQNVDSSEGVNDALDVFMMRLEAGAAAGEEDGSISNSNNVNNQGEINTTNKQLNIDSSGSMVRMARFSVRITAPTAPTASTATAPSSHPTANANATAYSSMDWDSDAPATPHTPITNTPNTPNTPNTESDDDEEEKARRAFIDALKKSAPPPPEDTNTHTATTAPTDPTTQPSDDHNETYETKSSLQSQKQLRSTHLRLLQSEATRLRKSLHSAIDTGRIYNDLEGGVMDEAERNLAALTAAPDALELLAEMNKKKELRAVDHDRVEYLAIRKNLYLVPQSLANLTPLEVAERRAALGVKVRGRGAPAPVSTFREAGLSERIVGLLEKKGIVTPFPVQAQCLPCIMAGRDVIGIAKTGSGKTLAFVLPMLRHIMDQPPLAPNETGPIGLILAPARELAYQIHAVCKSFSKHLGLKSTAVYGGAGVAEQIGDLKRGTHVLCATPGRLIDILTMQSGKLISLQRVSMVCLDESDRAFDMGFEPQISAILSAVRPDRQTVLFSATFPKAVENLAKKSLRTPLEIIVGGRSVASDSVDQYAEVVEEEDKFLRLLQLLGDHADDETKVIVFVGRQEQADSLFEQLTRCGYSSLSIHGGMDQEDRDSNMSDFKRADGPNVLVATSVAGRGLDVPSCGCVINYSCPNHLEDYVHRVGRTGRAGNRGVAYTFVNSTDEAKFSPSIVRALVEAGQSKNISQELKDLSESFKEKVAKGEARWASSGYKGKGYTYDSSEMNDAQKLARLEKREALIEAGLIDPDEDEGENGDKEGDMDDDTGGGEKKKSEAVPNREKEKKEAVGILANVSAEYLAIPGMREHLLRKAGMLPEDDGAGNVLSTGENHFVEELEINDYPREARWKVTQKETTSRLQDEFQTAVTLKGMYMELGKTPSGDGERKLYLHLEAQSLQTLQKCIVEVKRLLNEETLRVSNRPLSGGTRYNVL